MSLPFFLHAKLNRKRASSLENGAKGDTGEASTDEVAVGVGARVGAAGNVLLAALVDDVLDGDTDDGDLDIELGALVEDTSTGGTGASTDQVGEGTAEDTGVDIGGVTGVDGLVAARELGLVTTLGLGLLDGEVTGDGEARLLVLGLSGGSGSEGSEAEEDSGDGELHFECGGIKD